jgi:hypothetical protein
VNFYVNLTVAEHFKVSHAVTTPTCVIAGCHPGDLTVIHSGAPRGCMTCHLSDGIAPSNDCSSCHDAEDVHPGMKEHAADVASCAITGCHTGGGDVSVIHAGTDHSCATCHGGDKTPTTNCLASDCHADGAPGTHDSHPSTVTSGTITIGGAGYKYDCTFCHESTELQTLHDEKGGRESCGACHPAPANTVKDTWLGGCVEGGCHVAATPLAMHGGTIAAHAGVVPGCTTDEDACHTGGSDVAIIHKDTTLGCTTCHGDGKTPIKVCATEGCHLGGEPPSHESHPATISTGTITINYEPYGVFTCTDCHPTELQAAHGDTGANESCAKCHPVPASSLDPWSGGCVQGDCHAVGSTLELHGSLDATHTLDTPASCTAGAFCHDGRDDIAVLHANTKDGCFTCHGTDAAPTRDCTTAGCHGTEDGHPYPNGHADLEVLHRSAPASAEITIAGVGYGVFDCSDCHVADLVTLHADADTPPCAACHPNVGSKLAAPWGEGCTQGSCHTTGSGAPMHADVTSAHETTPGSGVATSCGTAVNSVCHANSNLTNVAKIHSIDSDGDSSAPGCAACHDNPNHEASSVCADCHPEHNTGTAHASTVTTGAVTILGTPMGVFDCADCHTTSGLIGAHGGATSCTTCHPSPVSSMGGWNGTCAQGGACHNPAQGSPVVRMHHDIDTGHHAGTALDTCGGSDCHSFSSNVALIHNGTDDKCAACHDGRPAADLTKTCATCHTETGASQAAHVALHVLPSPRTDGCDATGCHTGTNLTAIANAHAVAGQAHPNCATCHSSTARDAVKAAILANDLRCIGCHADVSHIALHNLPSPRTDGCDATGCHTGTNLTAILKSVGVQAHSTCATCHSSAARDDVKAAILANDLTCDACHSTAHAASHDGCSTCHDDMSTLTFGYHSSGPITGRPCSTPQCHGTPFTPMSGVDAYKYHVDTRPNHCVYSGCHNGVDVAGSPSTLHLVNRAGDACGNVGCHPNELTNLTTIHVGGCATCHSSTVRDAVKSAIAEGPTGKACATCHGSSISSLTLHPSYDSTHTTGANPSCAKAGCHVVNLITIHAVDGDHDGSAPGCAACHAAGKTLSKDCNAVGCHPGVTSEATHAP